MPGDFEKYITQRMVGTNVSAQPGNQWYHPVLAGASTLSAVVLQEAVVTDCLKVLGLLQGDDYSAYLKKFLAKGLEQCGAHWRYADICTVLLGLARQLRVGDYMEIGVRRGRSMSMVASQRPNCRIVGFDMWMDNYAGMDNPGQDAVTAELAAVGYQGKLELVSGDSHQTVPAYFEANPERYFDMITVDGDHSDKGALDDLLTVLPRLKVGGVLVFDDIAHPAHPYLLGVWRKAVANRAQFSSFEFTEIGYGVAFAVRHF
jgi:predicted O-methyltransferase YrrM